MVRMLDRRLFEDMPGRAVGAVKEEVVGRLERKVSGSAGCPEKLEQDFQRGA